jgi:outer membrane protein assembly factor BamB
MRQSLSSRRGARHSSSIEVDMRTIVLIALLGATSATLAAENWPQWRGPQLNGVSRETNLPVTWDTATNITWKLALPSWSGATPIVWGDHIFLNVADGENLFLWAVDRRKGTKLWERPLSGGNHKERKQNMSSPSPVTDGTRVWVMTGTGILKAFDFAGAELWARDIQADYGRFGLNWGYASSPLLHDGALYVQVLHGMKTDDPSYVLKIDARTGKTLWKVERPTEAIRESPDSYTTPALLRHGSTTEIVITGGDVVTGHDPATGKELWRMDGLNPRNNPNYRIVASPVVHGGLIYAPTRERPLLAIKPGGRGDITGSHLAWSSEDGPDVPTPVTDGTYFYIVRDNGVMWCLDAKTGKPIYGPERLKPGTYSSSPVLADGKLYISNEDGLTSVVKAGPKFEILAENALNDYILSSPAISDGQVFVRTAGHLWAIGTRKAARGTGN